MQAYSTKIRTNSTKNTTKITLSSIACHELTHLFIGLAIAQLHLSPHTSDPVLPLSRIGRPQSVQLSVGATHCESLGVLFTGGNHRSLGVRVRGIKREGGSERGS